VFSRVHAHGQGTPESPPTPAGDGSFVGLRRTGEVADCGHSPNLLQCGIGGVGGGANRRDIVGGDLAAAIVDEPDVDRTVVLARPSLDRRPSGAGKVGVAPLL